MANMENKPEIKGGINAVYRITGRLEEESQKEEEKKESNAIGDVIYTQEGCEKNKVAQIETA